MSDPIGALAARLSGASGAGNSAGASWSSSLRAGFEEGLQGGSVGGADAARRYTVDVGKGSESVGGGPSFGDTLTRMVNQVSDAQDTAGALRAKFLRGEPVELHQVMAAGEEAGIALELMIELRNKFTEAYRTLINMQS